MKKIIALLMAVAMLFCFAGCGDKEETIVVGYTIYEPMNYFDGDKLVGFDTELAEAVFGNLGYKVIFKEIKWENKYTDLSSGTIDCIWNGFTANVADDEDGIQRSEKVDFSYNYMENLQVVVADKDSGIKTAADLKGKTVVAETGSAGETYAKKFDGVVIKSADVQTDGLIEVKAKTADATVLDNQLAKSYCGKGDYKNLAIVEGLESDVEYYAIGFEKGSELTAKVNAELVKLAKDGTISEIAKKYGVESTTITDYSDQIK